MKRLVLLDFDGTLTRKDTLLEFIRYYRGDLRYFAGMILLSPLLIALKLKLMANDRVKQNVLTYFFKGEPSEKFNERCRAFASAVIPRLVRSSAHELLNRERNGGAEIVVVSASPENWVKPWCDANAIACLATRLEIVDRQISGKISG